MAYDEAKDRYKSVGARSDLGRSCRTENIKSDTVDLNPYAKAVQVVSAGTLKVLPVGNINANKPVTYGSVPVGFITPFQVGRIYLSGTTAGVITIDD